MLNFNIQVVDERSRSKVRSIRKVKDVVKVLKEYGGIWQE